MVSQHLWDVAVNCSIARDQQLQKLCHRMYVGPGNDACLAMSAQGRYKVKYLSELLWQVKASTSIAWTSKYHLVFCLIPNKHDHQSAKLLLLLLLLLLSQCSNHFEILFNFSAVATGWTGSAKIRHLGIAAAGFFTGSSKQWRVNLRENITLHYLLQCQIPGEWNASRRLFNRQKKTKTKKWQ